MKLSARLEAVANMVSTSVIADVGSDHGKLVISLFESGRISKGYAIENKKGPYNRLVKEIAKCNIAIDNIIPMFSDGISELPTDVSTVVIAGMGGQTVIDILKSHEEKLAHVKYIIVDAHNAVPEVRKEICELGFYIQNEAIVYEDEIYYEIIKFAKGEQKFLDDKDFEFGPILRTTKSVEFKNKCLYRIAQIDKILEKKELPEGRIAKLNSEKERIRQVL